MARRRQARRDETRQGGKGIKGREVRHVKKGLNAQIVDMAVKLYSIIAFLVRGSGIKVGSD